MSEALTVTKRTGIATVDARIAERKAQNAVAAQIRGTVWSKDLGDQGVRALAEYCRANNLDPVRHVEVLGGRVYLTATLYEERAAPLVQQGVLIPQEPEFINRDARLDEMAADGDEWAKEENTRRKRLRIKYNAPERADAIVVQRIKIASTGEEVVGVNWCGKGLRMESKEVWEYDKASGKRKPTGRFEDKDMDPVGGNEPAKTALTRAGRRAWKLVCAAVPSYGQSFEKIERGAEAVSDAVAQIEDAEFTTEPVFSGARVGMSLEPADIGEGAFPLPTQEGVAA